MAYIPDKLHLSNSVNGKGIAVSTTVSGLAKLIHTSHSTSGILDEVWLYATNNWTGSATLILLWGAQPNNESYLTIPNKAGRYNLADGRLIASGLSINAFIDTPHSGAEIIVDGFVNRLTYP